MYLRSNRGFALGIAACLIAFIRDELSYDTHYPDWIASSDYASFSNEELRSGSLARRLSPAPSRKTIRIGKQPALNPNELLAPAATRSAAVMSWRITTKRIHLYRSGIVEILKVP